MPARGVSGYKTGANSDKGLRRVARDSALSDAEFSGYSRVLVGATCQDKRDRGNA